MRPVPSRSSSSRRCPPPRSPPRPRAPSSSRPKTIPRSGVTSRRTATTSTCSIASAGRRRASTRWRTDARARPHPPVAGHARAIPALDLVAEALLEPFETAIEQLVAGASRRSLELRQRCVPRVADLIPTAVVVVLRLPVSAYEELRRTTRPESLGECEHRRLVERGALATARRGLGRHVQTRSYQVTPTVALIGVFR